MLQRYPILEFLYSCAGVYNESDGEFHLELRRNGYDFLLLTQGASRQSQIYGVVGVSGSDLKLHASLGLPNIMVFSWPHALEETGENVVIEFKEQGVSLAVTLDFNRQGGLEFSIKVGERQQAKHILQKA